MKKTALLLVLLLVAWMAFGMLASEFINAQQVPGKVLTAFAKIYPQAGKEDEVAALLVKMVEAVKKSEPDCLVYRVHRAAKEPVVFIFYEQYRSDAAYDFHRKAPHLAAYREQLGKLVTKPTDLEFYYSLTD